VTAFTQDLTPVAQPGQAIQLDDGDSFEVRQVRRLSPLPAVPIETITVDANGTARDVELTGLEVWDGWMAQLRPLRLADEVPADVSIELDHGGKNAPMWTVKNQRTSIDRATGGVSAYDADADGTVIEAQHAGLTEIFVRGESVPYITVTNGTGAEVDVDLTFSGFLYELTGGSGDGVVAQVPVANTRGN